MSDFYLGWPDWWHQDDGPDDSDNRCPGCGAFIAGIEAEMSYMQQYGVCSHCVDELRAELGEDEDDDDDPLSSDRR